MQFQKKETDSLQLTLVATSVLALLITMFLNLFGPVQEHSSLIRNVLGFVFSVSILILLILILPKFYKWAASIFQSVSAWKHEKRLIINLKGITEDSLHYLFDTNNEHSLHKLLNKLTLSGIKYSSSETQKRISVISDKLFLLSEWRDLLEKSFCSLDIKSHKETFRACIRDVTRFNRALGRVIEELASIDLKSDNEIRRNRNDEEIITAKYNQYIAKLEELLSTASKLSDALPRQNFSRLSLK
ncbi:MAG: hypothetical protein IIA17_02180 [candidate division Zixibacteria bacterium]|nr:hypothetical protein [candidate division Zixibacteria bacterium]